MEHTSRDHEAQDGAQAEMRAVPGFDQETGRLAGVTLTRRPLREGASIGVHTERPDLDAALPTQRGWHWFEDREDIVCELARTVQDALAQVAEDVFQDRLTDYRMHGYDPAANPPRFGDQAEQLREVATQRRSSSAPGCCDSIGTTCAEVQTLRVSPGSRPTTRTDAARGCHSTVRRRTGTRPTQPHPGGPPSCGPFAFRPTTHGKPEQQADHRKRASIAP